MSLSYKEELDEEYDYIIELCPYCEEEVALANRFEAQMCPNCSNIILPCCICETDSCRKCPLEEN